MAKVLPLQCFVLAPIYQRRKPEETVLHHTLDGNLGRFIRNVEQAGREIPRFVLRELDAYLRCGNLNHGFVRVVCGTCQHNHLVAFSCKGRGFCPSCAGRRTASRAAHLIDHVIPEVPVRQWVFSLPIGLRYRLAYNPELTSTVLQLFMREVFRWYRHHAKKTLRLESVKGLKCGSVTAIQRFGSALNLNIHFHVLVLDGVYRELPFGRRPKFYGALEPSGDDVAKVLLRARGSIAKALAALDSQGEDGELETTQPFVAECTGASLKHRVATGVRAGQTLRGSYMPASSLDAVDHPSPRCARVDGYSLHANTRVSAANRNRLEKLCRYIARGPIATHRLRERPDGLLEYRLKRAWSNGLSSIIMSPTELIEKLVPLIPRPRKNLMRYHGVLAPNASLRSLIVPGGGVGEKLDNQPSNDCWAALMRRVFELDVLECPKCGGRMEMIAVITEQSTIKKILTSVGFPGDSPANHVEVAV